MSYFYLPAAEQPARVGTLGFYIREMAVAKSTRLPTSFTLSLYLRSLLKLLSASDWFPCVEIWMHKGIGCCWTRGNNQYQRKEESNPSICCLIIKTFNLKQWWSSEGLNCQGRRKTWGGEGESRSLNLFYEAPSFNLLFNPDKMSHRFVIPMELHSVICISSTYISLE